MPGSIALDKNKVRYTYLKANIGDKVGLKKNVIEERVVTSTYISDILEIDFGVKAFTASNQETINFDITFTVEPTVIAVADDNVNISIFTAPVLATSFILQSSEIFTGNVYWLAISKTARDNIVGREVAMIVDSGTVTYTSSNAETITFAKKEEFKLCESILGLQPIILVSATDNVNLYLSGVSWEGFTLKSSEKFTGTAYWTALMIRKL